MIINASVVMNKYLLNILNVFPIFTFAFTLWVVYVSLGILYEIGQSILPFIFLCFQVYVNWLAIIVVTKNCTTATVNKIKISDEEANDIIIHLYNCDKKPLENNNVTSHEIYDTDQYLTKNAHKCLESNIDGDFINNVDVQKIWYCQKCCLNSTRNCHHCPLCNKCVFERDHHCFFLGACICQQNMKHFIVILFYTSLVSFYVNYLICVEMNLYHGVYNDITLIVHHFLPMSFAKWLIGKESMHNLLQITLLNLSVSLALFASVFSIYYLYLVASGQIWPKTKKYFINRNHEIGFHKSWKNVALLFGRCGIFNFIVPIPLIKAMTIQLGISENALKYS